MSEPEGTSRIKSSTPYFVGVAHWWGGMVMTAAITLAHLRRVSVFRLATADWKLAAENCIRYGGSAHKPCVLIWCLERPLTCGSALRRPSNVRKIFFTGLPGVKGLLQGEARTLWVLGVWAYSAPGGLGLLIKEGLLMSKSWTDLGMMVLFLVYLGLENT